MRCNISSFVQFRTPRFVLLIATLVVAPLALTSVAAYHARAATLSGATGAHDPSRIIYCNGKYYVYATGGGMKYSTDGIVWTAGPSPFPPSASAPTPEGRPPRGELPASVKALVPANQGIWAPDVIFYNNKYLLYYSACAPTAVSRCVTGLLTSPTLDPSAPGYKWTDAGVVLDTHNNVLHKSALDVGPFVDAKGNLWMSWGSGYANGGGPDDPEILISRLDNATGLRSTTDTTFYPVAPGHIEASYVHYHDGYYYIFWNDGGCCGGTNSTYRIFVARSSQPSGPYVNKAVEQNKGDIFMATDKERQVYGPGHMGILSEPGLDRFSFHYYNAAGRPVLGVRTLVWNADGWPSVGQDLPPGTYKITAGDGLVLGIHGGSSADSSKIELQPSTNSESQRWTVALTPDGYYQLASASGGKALEAAAQTDSGTKSAGVDQALAGTDPHPQWIVDLTSDGKTYRLRSRATSKMYALSVAAGRGRKKTAALTTTQWVNLPTQKWVFTEDRNRR